jgi:hypothetical protein
MVKKFWHRLTQEQQTEIRNEKPEVTTRQFLERFKVPSWCEYHKNMKMDGKIHICMSLTNRRKVISKKKNCSKCPHCQQ